MYKVFIKDLLIIIKSGTNLPSADNKLIRIDKPKILKDYMNQLFGENLTSDNILISSNEDELFEKFSSYFKIIIAAGGLVLNKHNQILFIKRLGYWDFPKGKMEKGENPEQTAIREVKEETSVKGLEIIRQINPTWHIYRMKDKWVLKKTYWFEMITDDDSDLKPQQEEDIEIAEWRNKEEAEQLLNLSYRSIREGFKDYFNY